MWAVSVRRSPTGPTTPARITGRRRSPRPSSHGRLKRRRTAMKRRALNHRHAVLSMVAAGLVVSGPGALVPGFPPGFTAQAVQAASAHKRITWDVAIDCRTWRFNGGISFEEFGRGDSFLADGRIFPAGTLGAGAQSNDPNDPGSIGNWTQRGTMAATWRRSPLARDRRSSRRGSTFWMTVQGWWSTALIRSLVQWPSSVAWVVSAAPAVSSLMRSSAPIVTGCPNLRLTINLKKQAPK